MTTKLQLINIIIIIIIIIKLTENLGACPQKFCQPCYSRRKPDRSLACKEGLYSQNFVTKPRVLRTTMCRPVRPTYLSALQKSILSQTTCRQNSTWIFPTNEQTAFKTGLLHPSLNHQLHLNYFLFIGAQHNTA